MLKRTVCERTIRSLCHEWRYSTGQARRQVSELRFADFFHWLRSNHQQILNFQRKRDVERWVNHWFDQEFTEHALLADTVLLMRHGPDQGSVADTANKRPRAIRRRA
jgi:hypothetical protein